MKLLAGTAPGCSTIAVFVVIDDTAVILDSEAHDLTSLIQGVAAGQPLPAAKEGAARYPVAGITPNLPVARPGKIICLGLNYAEHAKEGGYDVPDYPAMFLRAPTSMIPAETPMVLPIASHTLDYEAELMVVVGKGGRHIPEAEAFGHVFGYTVFNDGSVREYQRKTHQWTPGKNFDCTGALGPLVVTPDELPAGAAGLQIQTRLNGRTQQNSNTSDMIFTVPRTISIISEVMTLEPGDLIAFGTPPGVGHARTPPLWMKVGDVVEVEIEGICICRNPIISEADMAAGKTGAE